MGDDDDEKAGEKRRQNCDGFESFACSAQSRQSSSPHFQAENQNVVDNSDIDVEPKLYDFGDEQELSEADKLRAAERFMVIDQGLAECSGCGYMYDNKKGDPEYPIASGVTFSQLPQDWTCPICGAEKKNFDNKTKEIAGFAENQKYGLGTNTMTGDEKLLLIYGSLLVFFGIFLSGYALN